MKTAPILFEDYDPAELTVWEDLVSYDIVIKESEGDDKTTCPVSIEELQDYIKLEYSLTRKVKIAFVRTANMSGIIFWLWKFRIYGDAFYLTVVREPDGQIRYGSNDAFTMTDEQYLVYDFYINNNFSGCPQTREDCKGQNNSSVIESTYKTEAKFQNQNVSSIPKNAAEEWRRGFIKEEFLQPKRNVFDLTVSFSKKELENEDVLTPGSQWSLTIDNITVKFHWCPPGTFMMGRSPKEPYPGDELDFTWLKSFTDELFHRVILTKGFWITEVPVTQDLYSLFMERNPSSFIGLKYPVCNVSWDISQVFLKQINKLAPKGRTFQLPTEAQWEYACRAGSVTAFNVGQELGKDDAIFLRRNISEVRRGTPNKWGIYDMHGCINEWCSDWYKRKYPLKQKDPTGAEKGVLKVLRGGSWKSEAKYCRSSSRSKQDPVMGWDEFGFRFIMVHKES